MTRASPTIASGWPSIAHPAAREPFATSCARPGPRRSGPDEVRLHADLAGAGGGGRPHGNGGGGAVEQQHDRLAPDHAWAAAVPDACRQRAPWWRLPVSEGAARSGRQGAEPDQAERG